MSINDLVVLPVQVIVPYWRCNFIIFFISFVSVDLVYSGDVGLTCFTGRPM
jgi:hypothetical protein